jgi:hypothetical protein
MNNKSIISLIAFFFLSMFYVAPASAGPTYINIEMPKECGAWKNAGNAHHCWALNTNHGKAGKRASFKCSGNAGNGKGVFAITTDSCGMIVFAHRSWLTPTSHTIVVTKGSAECLETHEFSGGRGCSQTEQNTLRFQVCAPNDNKCRRSAKAQPKQ